MFSWEDIHMRKFLALLAAAALAGGIATTALAEPVETPIGTLTVDADNGSVEADGADSNPDPADGYVTVDANGVCGADDGNSSSDPDEDGGASCNEAFVEDVLGNIPA